MTDLSLIGVAVCVPLVVIFGIIALLNTTHIYKDDSVVFYLTARNTFGARRIRLSFFGVAVGAWLFLIPSQIIADPIKGTGLLGMISFSGSFFGAIWMFGWLGAVVKERYPEIISIGDYAKTRFDYSTQLFITAVVFGNIVLGKLSANFFSQGCY